MKICLAIGDRKCEDFIKSTLSILLAKLNEEGLDRITPLIEDIYNRPDYDNATKKEKKREILLEYFDGHEFLSSVSLTTLRTARNSGITEVEFVEEAPYREIVVDRCKGRGVDVLILSEMLPGQSNFQSICHELRVTYPSTRVIIAGGIHEKGDSFLKGLTEKGIYDIAYGETLSIMDIFKLLFHPNTYADSLKYLSNEQANNQPKDTNPFAGASNTLNVAPITPDKPAPKKESKIFSPKKKTKRQLPM